MRLHWVLGKMSDEISQYCWDPAPCYQSESSQQNLHLEPSGAKATLADKAKQRIARDLKRYEGENRE
jgi:hypothetical protein